MHEYSIAQQIANVVFRTARENEAQLVERVVVIIGEMALLNEEQVRFWVEEIFSHREQTRSTELDIQLRPATARCSGCGFQGAPPKAGPEAHFLTPVLICPECGQQGLSIVEGRECLIQRVTLKK